MFENILLVLLVVFAAIQFACCLYLYKKAEEFKCSLDLYQKEAAGCQHQ